jgi:CRISPR system Cascade subunit CasA
MSQIHHNLLEESLISITAPGGARERTDLPGVLARLARGEEVEFPALQAHQQQAWHAFLVQLAALALHRAGESEPPGDEESWRRRIGGLAEDPAAFCLVVEDLARPAFFQPPVPEGALDDFKRASDSPEILDVLITAKNHDVKTDRFTAPADPEHWIYALITLQTMEGFLGRGNYGIARMNGGFASRPEVALAGSLGWSARFRRDLAVLLAQRSTMVEEHGFRNEGTALVWTLPWEGAKNESLGLSDLDPFYLEVCRRVRLACLEGRIHAFLKPTAGPRVQAGEHKGNLGDPWTPIRRGDGAALTVGPSGLNYRLVQELLFGDDYVPPPALTAPTADGSPAFALLRVLVRGQGKTEGLHQRQLEIPRRVVSRFRRPDERAALGIESQARVKLAGEVRLKVLKVALLALLQERLGRDAGSHLDFRDERADPWLHRFDREVDRVFFPELFGDLEQGLPPEEREENWQRCLDSLCREIFEEAVESLAPAGIHRYRALAGARSRFYALRHKVLELLQPVPSDDAPIPATTPAQEVSP